ncbi:MAG: nucleoside phosphorylase [Thermodesulfobacteriota bacterium]
MSFTPLDLALIRKAIGLEDAPARRVDFAKLWISAGGDQEVGLAGWAMGAPMAVYLMERLIALGARWIVGVGSCGSLQPHLRIGDVILPTGASIEEGTSAHYRGEDVTTAPDPAILGALRAALMAQGVDPALGPIWTTDAPFRETVQKVTRYRDEGLLAVEMEASALMTVASFRRVGFCSLLVVSDELGDLKWRRGFTDPLFSERLGQVARVAVTVLKKSPHFIA